MVVSIIIPLLLIALVVMLIAGVKVNSYEGGGEMIKTVYTYLVLFATLMMTIGGSVSIFMAVADIIAPTPYYQSFEDFKYRPHDVKTDNSEGKQQLSDEELRKQYDAIVSAEKERQVERAKNTLIKSFGWVVIPFPIFMYFQRRLAKKEF